MAFHLQSTRKRVWHGTSSRAARRILREGFVVNPQTKVWDQKEYIWKGSYSGTYLTFNWFTAYSSANRAVEKSGGTPVIFEVQVETKTALPDEDNLPMPHDALAPSLKLVELTNYWVLELNKNPRVVKKIIRRAADHFRATLDYRATGRGDGIHKTKFAKSFSDKRWKALRPHVTNYLWEYWRERVAHATRYPPHSAGEREFSKEQHFTSLLRRMLANLIKKMRWFVKVQEVKGDTGFLNLRIDAPITFRGSNKILSAVELLRDDYSEREAKFDQRYPTILRQIYGKMSPEFVKQYSTRVGDHYIIEKGVLGKTPTFTESLTTLDKK